MKKNLLSTISMFALMAIPMGANAQDQNSTDTAAQRGTLLEEILVTAQRRVEGAQDVPIAITAFSGEQIERLGFQDSTEIVMLTPGMQVVSPNGGSSNFFTIRGVSQNDFIDHQESPIATYVDGVYNSQMSGTSFLLFDIDRVEILKGPQGSLFGRNATGGLVHFITKRPSQETSGYVDLTYGSFNDVNLDAAYGSKISDTLSFRTSIAIHESDPFIDNRVGTGLRENSSKAGRIQFLFEPTDRTSVLLNVRGAETDVEGLSYNHRAAREGGTFLPATEDFWGTGPGNDLVGYRDTDNDPYTGDWDNPGFNKIETFGASATIRHDMDNLSLVSVTDINTLNKDFFEDSDASPVPFLNFFLQSDVEQFSQEVRLEGGSGKLEWIVGGYYLSINGDYVNGIEFLLSALGDDPANDIALRSPWTNRTRSGSLFAHVGYDLSDTFEVQAGFRWNNEKKTHLFEQTVVAASDRTNILASVQNVDLKQNTSDWSGDISLNYRPNDDILLYASWRRGLKSGGFNAPLEIVVPLTNDEFAFDQEILYSYEIGLKADFPEARTRFNASAFYYDYKDYQAFNFAGLTQTVFNEDATIYGIEAELTLNPVDGLDMLFGAAFMDAETAGGLDITFAPKSNFTGLVRYAWPVSKGEISIQADGSYISSHFFNLSNVETVKEDGYALFNARIAYENTDNDWEISASVKNAFNTTHRLIAFDVSSLGFVEEYLGNQRTYSVGFKYHF